ncbi:MAG: hypothetical protein ABSC50_09485 [Candidatus Bathyarchaeia archaeon]
MISNERIKEADRNVKQYIDDGLFRIKDESIKKFTDFFMRNAESSLQTAALLYQISEEKMTKDVLKIGAGFESYLWVIVCSYYSMFYAATALLAREGMKARGEMVHKVTADALIHFYISNKKLAKFQLQDYDEAKDVAGELVGREELMKRIEKKAGELIVAYEAERKKRSQFQYDTGLMTKKGYANTSLDRAKRFVGEISKILKSGSGS